MVSVKGWHGLHDDLKLYEKVNPWPLCCSKKASLKNVVAALVLYQFVNPTIQELDYSSNSSNTPPHVRWILVLVLQMISILTSALSTFNPIFNDMTIRSYKKYQKPPSLQRRRFLDCQNFTSWSLIVYRQGIHYLQYNFLRMKFSYNEIFNTEIMHFLQ